MKSFWNGARRIRVEIDEDTAPADQQGLDGREAALLLKTYEDSAQGWFWTADADGRLTYVTDAIGALLEPGATASRGTPLVDLFRQARDDEAGGRTLRFLLARRSRFERIHVQATSGTGNHWWAISGFPQFDEAGEFAGYRGIGVDVTEQRRSSEHAARLAMYDSLTGLPNRLHLADVLETEFVPTAQRERFCAILLIDLDRFKQVNDTLGHPAGDALLKQVSDRLLRLTGDRERVFRLGGDEFQVIVRDCEDRGVLGGLATDIITSLSQPYSVEGSRCVIGASIGIAVSPFDGRSGDELIRNADLALYAAKESGRGRYRFFSGEFLKAAEDKRQLEEDIRDALTNGEFELFYQPVVSAKNNVTTGVEALVRWQHPVRGPISPTLFIPIIEESNLIGRFGEWALRQACQDAAAWPGSMRVAVNVSPLQFGDETLPAIILSALAASGLAPDRLELEITEGVFLSDSARTDTMFAALKDIGVRLALDDFGTGYSSLGYLRTAPFDKIKIDQSFVREATLPGSRNRAIIAAIVALAEALDMETTAEGIESLDQLQLIRDLRVSHVQGYVYSPAIANASLLEKMLGGSWAITPSGPAKQRSARFSMYRQAGAIAGNHYHSILVRNLSESGALIEGLTTVPEGGQLIVDFGEGQLAFARVRRSIRNQHGIEFEQPMVSDGNGGLCTSHRVSPYQLHKAGLPASGLGQPGPILGLNKAGSFDELRAKLGLMIAPQPVAATANAGQGGQKGDPSKAVGGGGSCTAEREGAGAGIGTPATPTLHELAKRYLHHLGGDEKRRALDRDCLEKHILPRFGQQRPDQLEASRVATWLALKVSEEGFPQAMVSRIQVILGQLYVLAMQWSTPTGPNETIDGIGTLNRRDERDRFLTSEEIEALKQATLSSANPQLKHIVALLLLTGARQRELTEAHWDDIDLAAGIWRMPSPKAGEAHVIRLSSAAVEAFRSLPRWDDCPRLIVNPKTKKPYHSFYNSWNRARMKAGVPDVELDDLRHSAHTQSGEADLSRDRVKAFLNRSRRRSMIRERRQTHMVKR